MLTGDEIDQNADIGGFWYPDWATWERNEKKKELCHLNMESKSTLRNPWNTIYFYIHVCHCFSAQALKLEYARLVRFAQEDTPPEKDYRLQHVIVYFLQNQAPKKILERTLLTQFADRNLAFDERYTTHNNNKKLYSKYAEPSFVLAVLFLVFENVRHYIWEPPL